MQNNETKKEFNQNEYIKEYRKSHYKQIQLEMTGEEVNILNEYCKDLNVSRAKYLKACVKYCIDNAIDIDELLSHLK